MTEIYDDNNIGCEGSMTCDEAHDDMIPFDDNSSASSMMHPYSNNEMELVEDMSEIEIKISNSDEFVSNNHGNNISFHGRTQDGINKLYDPEILKANEKLLEGAKELQNAHTEREFKDATAKMEEARNSVKFWEQAKLDMERIETPLLSWESVEDRYNKMGG